MGRGSSLAFVKSIGLIDYGSWSRVERSFFLLNLVTQIQRRQTSDTETSSQTILPCARLAVGPPLTTSHPSEVGEVNMRTFYSNLRLLSQARP